MSNPNSFEEWLSGVQPPEPITEFTCDIIHPLVDEYVDTLFEDCQKIDPVDMSEALKFILTDAEQQVMSCMAQEIMNINGQRLDESESAARSMIEGPDGDGEELEEAPLLIPREGLQAMIKQALTISYLVIPKVISHFD